MLGATASLKMPGLKLCVVGGEANLISDYQRKCRDIGLADRVVFAGMQKDVRPFLGPRSVSCCLPTTEQIPAGDIRGGGGGGSGPGSPDRTASKNFSVDGKNGFLTDTTAEGVRGGLAAPCWPAASDDRQRALRRGGRFQCAGIWCECVSGWLEKGIYAGESARPSGAFQSSEFRL